MVLSKRRNRKTAEAALASTALAEPVRDPGGLESRLDPISKNRNLVCDGDAILFGP